VTELYTPLYEWVAECTDLTLREALVLCRVRMWGNNGCFESDATLGKKLKLSRATVKRAIKSLLDKTPPLIEKTHRDKKKQKRILKFNFQLTNLPLFDGANKGQAEPGVSKTRLAVSFNQGHSELQPGSQCAHTIHDKTRQNSATPSPLPADGQAPALRKNEGKNIATLEERKAIAEKAGLYAKLRINSTIGDRCKLRR